MLTLKYYNNLLKPKYLLQFIYDVIKTGKLSELTSFVIWEISYRLGFYKNSLLKFNNHQSFVNLKSYNSISGHHWLNLSKHKWDIFFSHNQMILGNTIESPNKLYLSENGEITEIYEFSNPIEAIYADKFSIFVCIKGAMFKVNDELKVKEVLQFSTKESIFRHNSGFTIDEVGTLFVGEYANIWRNNSWQFVAYLYYSRDGGDSWIKSDFLENEGINKHIHLVWWSKLLKLLVLTDGDNKKKLWVNKSQNYSSVSETQDAGWYDCTINHIQRGGYTAAVEVDECILFGSDYQGGTNCLISTKDMKNFDLQIIPNPYRGSYFHEMVTLVTGKRKLIIANLKCIFSSKNKSLLMTSLDDGNSWFKIIEYDGTNTKIRILNNSDMLNDTLFMRIDFEGDIYKSDVYKIELEHLISFISSLRN